MPKLKIRGEQVDIKDQITYLGVELHRVLGFRDHIEAEAAKAQTTHPWRCQGLCQMWKVWDTGTAEKEATMTVVFSKCSTIWFRALEHKRNVESRDNTKTIKHISY